MLGIEQIGIQDNFFEAGGDSLMGLRIMNQLGQIFEVDLSTHLLFTKPTVAGMAEIIRQKRDEEAIADEELAEMLQNVSQMSEEEALLLLEKKFLEQEIQR